MMLVRLLGAVAVLGASRMGGCSGAATAVEGTESNHPQPANTIDEAERVLTEVPDPPDPPELPPFAIPAVPLIVHHPYFQVYSPKFDRQNPTHQPGALFTQTVAGQDPGTVSIFGGVRVDGVGYSFLGGSKDLPPLNPRLLPPTVRQLGQPVVWPTRTVYQFVVPAAGLPQVHFNLTWMSPLLPGNTSLLARPVTYATLSAVSADGHPHAVSFWMDGSAELAANQTARERNATIVWSANASGAWLRNSETEGRPIPCGCTACNASGPRVNCGDSINWGRFFLATTSEATTLGGVQSAAAARYAFLLNGTVDLSSEGTGLYTAGPQPNTPAIAAVVNLSVATAPVSATVLYGFDQEAAIRWWGSDLREFWTTEHPSMEALLTQAKADLPTVAGLCEAFDHQEVAKYIAIGGPKFAAILSAAWRQAYGSTTLVWNPKGFGPTGAGEMQHYLKEISTGDDLQTLDVIYPAIPLYIYGNPDLAYRLLVPLLEYANNGTGAATAYPKPYAPHHLGTYPVGYILPFQQEDMPVEETANVLLILAAIAQRRNGSVDFVGEQYWPVLAGWASFLTQSAADPGNQRCTDDFMGPSIDNANLAVKGIIALGAYAQLLRSKGEAQSAAHYAATAQNFSKYWMGRARDNTTAGGPAGVESKLPHYRQAYGEPGTWSLKYNLLWDRLLGTNLFPQEVFDTEVAFYRGQLSHFGVPLDNRRGLTKSDWMMWSGAMGLATANNTGYFGEVTEALFAQLEADTSNKPLTDLYNTSTAKGGLGPTSYAFRDRAVVGAFWAAVLLHEAM